MPSLIWTELAEVHGCEGGELDTHIGGQGVALRPVLGAGPSTEQILQIWSISYESAILTMSGKEQRMFSGLNIFYKSTVHCSHKIILGAIK